jgi:hypothetical protein
LKLDEDVDEGRRVAALPQAPDDVAVAALEVFGDMGAIGALQGGEVELLDPGLSDEPSEEILDHPGLRKEKLVTAVVLFQG